MKLLREVSEVQETAAVVALPTSPAQSEAAITKSPSPGTQSPSMSTPTSAQQKRKAMLEKNQSRNVNGRLTPHLPRRKRARTEEVRLIKLEGDEISNILIPGTPPPVPREQHSTCGICQAIIPISVVDQKVCDVCRAQSQPHNGDWHKTELQLKLNRLGERTNQGSTSFVGSVLGKREVKLDIVPTETTDEDVGSCCNVELCLPTDVLESAVHVSCLQNGNGPQMDIDKEDAEDGGHQALQVKEEPIRTEPQEASRRPHPLDRVSKKEQEDVADGIIEIPGVTPSLMDFPDLPDPYKDNFLQAGLLSKYYKSTQPKPPIIDASLSEVELITALNTPVTKETICPPIPETGSRISLLPSEDYQLPYDIFCFGVIRTRNNFHDWIKSEEERRAEERKKKKLKQPRTSTPRPRPSLSLARATPTPVVTPDSWTFKRLRYNNYLGGYNKPQISTQEDHRCECKESELKCSTDECLNRVVFTECPPSCGDNCMNRRIQKHEWVMDLKQFLTEDKGYGVKCLVPLKRASIILEYVGEVVTAMEFRRRMLEIYANDTHHYCLQLDSGLVIDGHRSGGKGRFVNHSCDPNCEMQKWYVNGIPRMALFTLRDIPADEELSYDYNFSLYNESEGQLCYCKSVNCRGVIGGKSKVNGKNSNKNPRRKLELIKGIQGGSGSSWILFKGKRKETAKLKAFFRKETNLIRQGHVFLVRNYERVRKMNDRGNNLDDTKAREKVEKLMAAWVHRYRVGSAKSKSLVLIGEDPKVSALARMSQIFFELYNHLTTARGPSDGLICDPFMEIPSKMAYPVFQSVIEKSKVQGLKSIEVNILQGRYESIQALEEDFRLVFTAFSKAYETEKPDVAKSLDHIKEVYKEAKTKALQALDPFIVLPTTTPSDTSSPIITLSQSGSSCSFSLPPFVKSILKPEDETILRCICGTFAEEGMMIQCDKCLVWQHCDCMRIPYNRSVSELEFNNAKVVARRRRGRPRKINVELEEGAGVVSLPAVKKEVEEDFSELATQVLVPKIVKYEGRNGIVNGEDETYYCEKCDAREVNPEVPMGGPNDTADQTFYLTLLREDGFLLRKDDTVYVLRDWPADQRLLSDGTPRPRLTYLNAGPLVTENCDILRIDSLWTDASGKRMLKGYNYFRPYETHHERNRRFYPNEILRAPVVELIDVEFVHGRCWVLDTPSYCIGRPIGSIEEHVYICDFRVNKAGRLFEKIVKKGQGISMKPNAFNKFETSIKIHRNFYPHGPPSPDFNPVPDQPRGNKKSRKRISGGEKKHKRKAPLTEYDVSQTAKKRCMQRDKLNSVLDALGKNIEDFDKDPVDLSNLLAKTRKTRKSMAYKSQE